MVNIFLYAKFGDKYVAKDGKIALFATDDVTGVYLYFEGIKAAVPYHYDGTPKDSKYSSKLPNIVRKKNLVKPKRIQELAENYCPTVPKYIDADSLAVQQAYKDGFFKALEEKL